jgi:hypothetical protein
MTDLSSRRLAGTPILSLVVGLALLSQRSTHTQDWSLSAPLPSQRRLLRPEFNRRASNCKDRPG